ncbi:MAG: hypothetical protein HN732_25115, partial [Rhodospirillaceae bacterium]|nr:hypothetical protein [Rhodospirillaceae bacterium]
MKKTMIRFLVIAVPVATLLTLPTAPANACLSGPLPPPCAGFGGGGVEGIGTLYLDQYFNPGGTAAASGDNVLWGDYFLVGGGTGFGGDSLVSVEADPNAEPSAGGYTFYSRYTSGAGADTREPLATSFATRYLSGDGNLGV